MNNIKRLTIFPQEEIVKTIKKMAIDKGLSVTKFIEKLVEEAAKKASK